MNLKNFLHRFLNKSVRLPVLVLAVALVFFASGLYLYSSSQTVAGNSSLQLPRIEAPSTNGATPLPETPQLSVVEIFDPECWQCIDLSLLVEGLSTLDAEISSYERIPFDSEEAAQIVASFKLSRAPALIVFGDTTEVEGLIEAWSGIGDLEADGTLVLRDAPPVYLDLNTGSYIGEVKLVSLSHADCLNCYDVSLHRVFLEEAMGMYFKEEQSLDAGSEEGKSLLEKYSIKSLPTIVLSHDAVDYPGFAEMWSFLGTVEGDGSFVFREMEQLGAVTYWDVEKASEVAIEAGEAL